MKERQKAIQSNSPVYWTGRPCKYGHIAWRRTKTGFCTQCDKLRQAQWREKYPEKRKLSYDKWRGNNLEAALNNTRQWRTKNRERSRANSRKWKQDNPEKNAAIRHLCDYRRKGVTGSCTKEDVLEIFAMQRKRCAFCRKKLKKYHIDHIVPISRGGSGDRANIQILCAKCNHKKHARDQLVFARSLGLLL